MSRGPTVAYVGKLDANDNDDPHELIYQTAILLGQNPKSLIRSELSSREGGAGGKRTFVPEILQTIITPSTLKITNMHIGNKQTTCYMVPSWFQPNNREAILKGVVYPDVVVDKHPYETIACYRAAMGRSINFNRNPINISERSTETLILSLDAFAKQFGGELNFTEQDLSFDKSTEQIACGIANMGSVHLLATEAMPTALFYFKVGLDYKKDLGRTPTTMSNFIINFSTAIAKILGCQKDYVRIYSVEKSSDVGISTVKLGLTIPKINQTKKLAKTLQKMMKSSFKKDQVLRYVKPAHYDYRWESVLSFLQLKPTDFDPKYNFDYTQSGLPAQQMRGNEPDYLPLGWYRHGLNVNEKYEGDNHWLGSSNTEGEWPVAFHGTHSGAVSSIAQKGLVTGTAKRDAMQDEAIEQLGPIGKGIGLYLATHCNGGSYPQYTQPFPVTIDHKTEIYCLVFECRVRPKSYSIHTNCVKEGHAWRVTDPTAIRPYGLLLKKEEI